MKIIEQYMSSVCEEAESAMEYAEHYIEYKASNPQWSRWYGEMAEQELQHAEYLRSMGQAVMDALAYVPEECRQDWENCNRRATEKMAMARLLISK